MINQSKILSILALIRKITKTEDVYLFGSYANGRPNENSDLDIAVIKDDTSNEEEESFEIRKKMLETGYVPLDLVFLDRKQFQKRKKNIGSLYYEIEKNGKKLSD